MQLLESCQDQTFAQANLQHHRFQPSTFPIQNLRIFQRQDPQPRRNLIPHRTPQPHGLAGVPTRRIRNRAIHTRAIL